VREIERTDSATIEQLKTAGYAERGGSAARMRLTKRREEWDLFEQRVRIYLMEGLSLEFADGGPVCMIGGHQIDACGGLERLFLVADAKHTGDPSAGSVRSMVDDLARKAEALRRGVAALYPGQYDAVCLAVFTNASATSEEIQYGLSHGVFVADARYFEEICLRMHSAIGSYSRYQVMRDFLRCLQDDQVPDVWRTGAGAELAVPAIRLRTQGVTLYAGFVKARDMLRMGYVARLESRAPNAYQRLLKADKLQKIAEFISDGNTFKNNLVIGLEGEPRFTRLRGRDVAEVPVLGELKLAAAPASAWIIDGQHRLYGFARVPDTDRDRALPVVAVVDEAGDGADHATTFIEINKNQTPIPPDDLWALLPRVQPLTNEGMIAEAGRLLNGAKPFKGKIYVPDVSSQSRSKYSLYLNNVCKGLLDRKILQRDSPYSLVEARRGMDRQVLTDRVVAVVADFFKVIDRAAGSNSVWMDEFAFTNNGFNIVLRLLAELLSMNAGHYSRARAQILEDPLGRFFARNVASIALFRGQSSEAGRANVAAQMIEAVNVVHTRYGHDYLAKRRRDRTKSSEAEVLRTFERMMRDVIKDIMLLKAGADWETKLPNDVRANAQARMSQNAGQWPWVRNPNPELLQYLDFTDYAKIIDLKWNYFECVFKERSIILGKLRELDPMRKDVMHSRSLEPVALQRLSMYFDDVRQLVEEWRSTEPGVPSLDRGGVTATADGSGTT
jgi:DGQHR domain-containing protein